MKLKLTNFPLGCRAFFVFGVRNTPPFCERADVCGDIFSVRLRLSGTIYFF